MQALFSSRHPRELMAEHAEREQTLFAAVKERLDSGKASTLKQAMEQISEGGEPAIKGRARYYLNPKGPKTLSKLVVGGLMELTQKLSPNINTTQQFLDETFKVLES